MSVQLNLTIIDCSSWLNHRSTYVPRIYGHQQIQTRTRTLESEYQFTGDDKFDKKLAIWYLNLETETYWVPIDYKFEQQIFKFYAELKQNAPANMIEKIDLQIHNLEVNMRWRNQWIMRNQPSRLTYEIMF